MSHLNIANFNSVFHCVKRFYRANKTHSYLYKRCELNTNHLVQRRGESSRLALSLNISGLTCSSENWVVKTSPQLCPKICGGEKSI
ncbi:hypothetical protein RRG08_026292 [Elysia crispata]|uniref:Uncharacterized protein n=1 Tax=Elysia crispata TaxID=231223 RepID=A0AAE0ZCB7_9GAST|nr:hypothetical protein RRG08_026292 [Elysia crispata]